MEGYSVKIVESSKSLTAKERIAIKDLSNAVALDNAVTDEDNLIINVDGYAILDVHNEKSKNDKDYRKYVVFDKTGCKYVTGSESFFSSFLGIFKEMSEAAPGEDYAVECYRKPSQNYKGKSFLTCSII